MKMHNYCETCTYRNESGHCINKNIDEETCQSDEERSSMLLYSYQESGSFWVGPKFGCVHHSERGEKI